MPCSADGMRHIAAKAMTHCKNGHKLAGDNLIVAKGDRRKCRTCLEALAAGTANSCARSGQSVRRVSPRIFFQPPGVPRPGVFHPLEGPCLTATLTSTGSAALATSPG